MPTQYSYTLFENKPVGITIDSISLLELEPELCMGGLKYFVTFNGGEVTSTTAPMKLLSMDNEMIRTQFYTEDRKYINIVQKLLVWAELHFGDIVVSFDPKRRLQEDWGTV